MALNPEILFILAPFILTKKEDMSMLKQERGWVSLMLKTIGAGALGAVLLLAGVVKTEFVDNGFFINGSSKTTGKGNQYTVCEYFDEMGEFISENQYPDVGFSSEEALEEFCISNEP